MVKFDENQDSVTTNTSSCNSVPSSFTNRQSNLVSLLDAVEKEYSRNVSHERKRDRKLSDWSIKKQKLDMKHYKKEESIFLKPDIPPVRISSKSYVPDFKLHPHKWTKYSLDDVSADDVSDASNTSAAFSFLKEMEVRKKDSESVNMDVDTMMNIYKPVFFKRSPSDQTGEPDNKCSSSFKGSAKVLPEYVVGSKVSKKKAQARTSPIMSLDMPKKNQIKLNHLLESDEIED